MTPEQEGTEAKETILVVEDGDAVRQLVATMLNIAGYRVLEARDGREAFEIWNPQRESIHLVLTDVLMPRMGGRELAQRLGELRPETRILFMTGYAEEVLRQDTTGSLARLLLVKPFTSQVLNQKVREVLDRPWTGFTA